MAVINHLSFVICNLLRTNDQGRLEQKFSQSHLGLL